MKRLLPFCCRTSLIPLIYFIISMACPAFAAGPVPTITSPIPSGSTTSTRPIPITINTGGAATELAQSQLQLTNTLISNFKRNYGITYKSKLATSGNALYVHSDKKTGRIYVADDQHDQIQVFNSNFQPVISPIGTSGTGDGQFASPGGIATDQSGNIYVTDQLNNRVEIFNSNGTFLRAFGTFGTAPGQLNYPAGIDVDASGKIYIANERNNRIDIFSNNGAYVTSFGTEGSAAGQFENPQDIKVDDDGNIYVADPDNNRVQVFKNDGSNPKTIGATTLTHPTGISLDGLGNLIVACTANSRIQVFKISDGSLLGTFGRAVTGSDDGDFNYPVSAASDGQGNIFIADLYNNRVQEFTAADSYTANLIPLAAGNVVVTLPVNIIKDTKQNGNSQAVYSIIYTIPGLNVTITSPTIENNSFTKISPVPITIGLNKLATSVTSTNLNITNATIANLKHNYSLSFKTRFGNNSTPVTGPLGIPSAVALDGKGFIYVGDADGHHIDVFTEDGQYVRNFGSNGTGSGQFNKPASIAIDANGNIYLTDQYASRIEVFDNNGAFLRSFGSFGTGNNQFNNPNGIWVDATKIYVVDQGNNCVKVFDLPSGHFLSQFGTKGSGPGQFDGPTAITGDNAGNIYVADGTNGRIQKFNSAYAYTSVIGSKGSADGQFLYPYALATDGTDKLYVVDNSTSRLQVFTLGGTLLGKAGTAGAGAEQFSSPDGIAVGKDGSIYVADQVNDRIQLLNASEGYTADIIPINGLITVTLPAGAIHDANNVGNNAVTFSFTYDVTPPIKPTGLVATSLDKGVKLDWSANPSADGVVTYQIYGGTTNNPTTLIQTVNAPATTFSQTGLVNGTTYYYRITATDNYGNVSPSSDVVSVIPKSTPVVTWLNPADLPFGTPLTATQLNATANVPGTFVYSPAAGSVLNFGSNQTLSVTFTPADNLNYNSVSKTVSINVIAATPVITWNNPADIIWGALLGSTQLNASTDIQGHFDYSPSLYTKLNVGPNQPLKVVFTPDDKTLYTTATKTVYVNVIKAIPVIKWDTPADINLGTALTTAQVNPTVTGVTGTFVYTPDLGTIMSTAGPQTLSATFTPTDQAHYNTVTASVIINVIDITKSTPVITWNTPADININTALTDLQLNASATFNGIIVPGDFIYTPLKGTVMSQSGIQTLHTIFKPTDAAHYNSISASVTINVIDNRKATPIVTWSNPANVTVGTALSDAQLNPKANVPGSFTYNPTEGTILNTPGSQTLTATFTPDNQNHYYNVTKTVTINVIATSTSKITPLITWNKPADVTVGTTLTTAQYNATANVPGTFTYSPIAGTILTTPGSRTLTATFTPDDSNKYNSVTKSYTISVIDISTTKQTPTITWNPADISIGSKLSAAQAGAIASVNGITIDGTFIYTPTQGTIMNTAGPQTLSALFTPKDQTKYNSASASRTINVIDNTTGGSTTPLTPIITWNPADITIGSALTTAQAGGAVATINGAVVDGTFVYTPGKGTVMSTAGPQTIIASFTPKDQTKYTAASALRTINVIDNSIVGTTPLTPIIIWNPSDITIGSSLTAAQAGGAVASVNGTVIDGTFVYTPAKGTVMSVAGPQTITASFTPKDQTKYNSASALRTINVIDNTTGNGTTPLTPIITWAPADINIGSQLGDTQLNAVAALNGTTIDGTFTYVPAKGTVMNIAGPQTLSATFTPKDPTKYNATSASATLNVIGNTPATNLLTPVITWIPVNINIGTQLDDAQLNAVATLNGNTIEGTFVYFPTKGTVINAAGTQTLTAIFTPKDLTKYNKVSASATLNVIGYNPTTNLLTPVITWRPADINIGTQLGNEQLNAVATLNGTTIDGTFTYVPANGTAMNTAGKQTLRATFTPNDLTKYNTTSVSATLNVIDNTKTSRLTPVITWSRPVDITYGTALSSNQLNATANADGTFTYSPVAGTILPAGIQTLSVSFNPTDVNHYNTATATVNITVNKAERSITFNSIPDKTYGDADFSPASSSSAEAIIYTSSNTSVATIVNGKVHIIGVGTTTITATLPANSNYTTNPSASQNMTVNKAYQTITFNPIPDLSKGDKYDLSVITASSGLPVTFSIVDPMIANIEGNNLNALRIGSTNLVAYQAGNANYYPANSIVQQVNVKDPNGNDIIVHQAVSPNGDGINETLYVEGIAKYPENRVTLINRNGVKIYEVYNYDNKTRYFDGKSNITGAMMTPGTYFYLIEFVANGQGRHLTGYFVLKY